MNKYIQAKQGDFSKVSEHFKKEISVLRTGRVNPGVLDNVRVEAYGVATPLAGLASISVSDARSMIVSPWDKSVLKDLEKGIVEANLGFGAVNEGDKIRLTMPMMTEENRKDLVKKLNEKAEEAKVSLRQVRDAVKGAIEASCKAKEISEDDKFRFLKELEEEVKNHADEVSSIRAKKEEEVMTI
jgi:ribosome recycling factor